MSDETHNTRVGSEIAEDGLDPAARSEHSEAGVSRRQLLKGGVAATPVVLTLLSRPALGVGVWDGKCSYAVRVSANPSQPLVCDAGRSPGYWKNRQSFPAPYSRYDRFYEAGFSHNRDPLPNTLSANPTLMEVLRAKVVGHPARHAIATLLNHAAGFIDRPTQAEVFDLYNNRLDIADEDLKDFFADIQTA